MKVDYANDPGCLNDLSTEQQAQLIRWLRDVLVPAKSVYRRTSYEMKHDFEREPEGFYVTNGMFKGAMLKAGYPPVADDEINWRFRVKPCHELTPWQGRQLGRWGRGWLVRDDWREKGYVILRRRDRGRIREHDIACRREGRPKVVVLLGTSLAEILLDTDTAGHRLTRDAVQEIMVLFTRTDRTGRTWSIVNEKMAMIRRVPMDWAWEIAAALVRIAGDCRLQPGQAI